MHTHKTCDGCVIVSCKHFAPLKLDLQFINECMYQRMVFMIDRLSVNIAKGLSTSMRKRTCVLQCGSYPIKSKFGNEIICGPCRLTWCLLLFIGTSRGVARTRKRDRNGWCSFRDWCGGCGRCG